MVYTRTSAKHLKPQSQNSRILKYWHLYCHNRTKNIKLIVSAQNCNNCPLQGYQQGIIHFLTLLFCYYWKNWDLRGSNDSAFSDCICCTECSDRQLCNGAKRGWGFSYAIEEYMVHLRPAGNTSSGMWCSTTCLEGLGTMEWRVNGAKISNSANGSSQGYQQLWHHDGNQWIHLALWK